MRSLQQILNKVVELRHALNACAEISGNEHQTRARILSFLRENTALELHDEGAWIWACHRETDAETSIAFRADFDAVPVADGQARHLCGHDGHAAALCGLALLLEGRHVGRNVYLIFQHAEETGEGGRVCAELLRRAGIASVYGCHNLPGYPFGQIQLRKGAFACASRGLILQMQGSSAHAAYPENGKNPAYALCEVIVRLPQFTDPADYQGMVMATPVGVRAGRRAFGMAASEGEVCLTLRAHRNADLEKLEARILDFCRERARIGGLEFQFERADVFPATENSDACVDAVAGAVSAEIAWLPEPMRWSEDFGWYLMRCPGAYFGIGAGEDHPGLHTPDYAYPDALLWPTMRAFAEIAGLCAKDVEDNHD